MLILAGLKLLCVPIVDKLHMVSLVLAQRAAATVKTRTQLPQQNAFTIPLNRKFSLHKLRKDLVTLKLNGKLPRAISTLAKALLQSLNEHEQAPILISNHQREKVAPPRQPLDLRPPPYQ